MKIYVDLACLTDGSPWTSKKVLGTVPTAGDYPAIVNYADRDWHWCAIATTDFADQKRRFHNQYALGRNDLVIVDDFRDVAGDATLISRCLNTCRLFCAAGGRAVWIDYPHFRDASGSNREWLKRVALEAI